MSDEAFLSVRGLATHFPLEGGKVLRAVDGVSFDVERGQTVGVVGESGCGKSTLAKTLIRLIEPTAGRALLEDQDIFGLDGPGMMRFRSRVQMVFQDPFSSLNPRRSAVSLIEQPLKIHKRGTRAERRAKVDGLMREVGLDPNNRGRYPHQFSGGQRQRIGIARALALQPEMVICDESVSALDVSVQAQVINLLRDLQDRHGLTYLFIAHDLSVVEFISDRILVMYLGRVVEEAPKAELARERLHPYTKSLFEAAPTLHAKPAKREPLKGELPSPIDPPTGCHFHARCPLAMPRCREQYPPLKEVAPGRRVACHLY